jgi:hypothetical protein
MSEAQRIVEFKARHNEIQARFESSYLQFRAELPAAIRVEGERVLRQLTASDPSRRAPAKYGRRPHDPWDLQWLLRRTDIMALSLTTASRTAARRKKAG